MISASGGSSVPMVLGEGFPLLLFRGIVGEGFGETERPFGWDICFSAGKGRGDCARERVALEFVCARQHPDVVEVFHAAVGAAELHDRLEFLGDNRLMPIAAQISARAESSKTG